MWRNEQRYSTSTVPLSAWLLASGCGEKRSDQIQVHVAEAKARDWIFRWMVVVVALCFSRLLTKSTPSKAK